MVATRKPYEIWMIVQTESSSVTLKVATVGTRDHATRFINSAHFPAWAYGASYGHKQFYKNDLLDAHLEFLKETNKHLLGCAAQLPGDSIATVIGIEPIMTPKVVDGKIFCWLPDFKLRIEYPISKRIVHFELDQIRLLENSITKSS